jgi:alpha-amylase
MLVQKWFTSITIAITLTACGNNENSTKILQDTATIDNHVAWLNQGNIYEVNVRQYTPEGTFAAFAKHLDRLKEMGVQTLWFMPINPISSVDRKGKLGSYYAISHYTAINPEFGNLDDFKTLVQQCHEKGFKVLIDWVANHTGADHYWLEKNPDFYVVDSLTQKPKFAFDWTDTRDLNYDNMAMQDSMIASMEFWLKETNIDGFRCDVATEVPESFWTRCIATLRKGRNIAMLAEGDKPWLHKAGFDISYAWPEFAALKKLAKGEAKATIIDTFLQKVDTEFATNALQLFFTSNHDENSWNKADYGTMPGAIHAPFAVLTQTIKRTVPLIYSGQEEPFLDSLSFFYKDTISFEKFARASFYKKLLTTRSTNEALASNASFTKLQSHANDKIYAFVREKNGKKVVVVLNFSPTSITANFNTNVLVGKPKELFTEKEVTFTNNASINLQPWDYKVFVY